MSILAIQSTTSDSRSSSRRSLSDKISALGERLTRTLGHPEENHEEEDSYSLVSEEPRSYYKNERGRDAFQSTGRGGLGNIRPVSLSRTGTARHDMSPDDLTITHGREVLSSRAPTVIFSTGRGGAGNLRSPSHDSGPSTNTSDPVEQVVIRDYAVAHEGAPVSCGRGGIGNIRRKSSRSQSTAHGDVNSVIPSDEHKHTVPRDGFPLTGWQDVPPNGYYLTQLSNACGSDAGNTSTE